MPKANESHTTVRKLGKGGGGRSFLLSVPMEFVRKLKWKEHQKIRLELKARHIIIKDWKK